MGALPLSVKRVRLRREGTFSTMPGGELPEGAIYTEEELAEKLGNKHYGDTALKGVLDADHTWKQMPDCAKNWSKAWLADEEHGHGETYTIECKHGLPPGYETIPKNAAGQEMTKLVMDKKYLQPGLRGSQRK